MNAGAGRDSGAGRLSPVVAATLLLVLLVLFFFAPLLAPSRALATRDMAELNYPLRLSWAKLVATGSLFPQWDPFAHGGQPLASNPNYGALYPPAWLALLLPAPFSINVLMLAHALVAAFGARRLARRLGAGEAGALLAAVVYACGSTYLAVLHALITSFGMSWLPWIAAAALERVEGEPAGAGTRPAASATSALRLAGATAMLLLSAAEPSILLMMGFLLAFLVLREPSATFSRLGRLVLPLALGGALAAVQLLPAAARLAESPRSGSLSFEQATLWSLPPARWPELFFPRVYGDVARPMSGLYFGWGVQDLDFPFLASLSVTLPLALLGVAALLAPASRRDFSWSLAALAGLFFALGRHNPAYGWLRKHLPLLGSFRFPEKFLLLTLVALLFAGVLAWKRILDARYASANVTPGPAPSGRGLDLPLALAALAAFLVAALAVAIRARPSLLESFLAARSPWPLSSAALGKATAFYRGESLAALAFALATLALFVAARWSRLPRRALEAGMLALVVADLAVYSRPLLRTVKTAALFAPPAALAAAGLPNSASPRIFSTQSFQGEANDLVPTAGDLTLNWVRAPIERLSSRAGNLFGLSYALDRDFDLTLTRPARRALELYERLRETPALAHRLLGAWSVERIAVQRAPASIVDDLKRGVAIPPPVTLAPNSYVLPQARFVADYRSFVTPAEAEAAAVAAGLPMNTTEFIVTPADAGGTPVAPAAAGGAPSEPLAIATLLADDDRGDARRIRYRGDRPSLLVVATTYDRRWRARAGELDLPLRETAGGYTATVVPAGEGVVDLRFRDPAFTAGAGVSGAALLAALFLTWRSRPKRARALVGAEG